MDDSEAQPLLVGSPRSARRGAESTGGGADGRDKRLSAGEDDAGYDDESMFADTRQRYPAYACFLVLGATVLLPWNLLIVITPYLSYRLRESSLFAHTASSWMPLIYNLGNFLFLICATLMQKKSGFGRVKQSVGWSVGALVGVVVVLLVTTMVRDIDATVFFLLMMSISVLSSAVCATLQSTSAALASVFSDPIYMQAVMSGQGAIGFAVALTQYLAALRADKAPPSPSGPSSPGGSIAGTEEEEAEKLVASTAAFFVVSLLFALFAGAMAALLFRLPLYRHTLSRHAAKESARDCSASPHHARDGVSLRIVNGKIKVFGASIALIYTVTIGLFPGLTSAILPVNASSGPATGSSSSSSSSAFLFVSFGFIVFNAGDWIGRTLPGFRRLFFRNRKGLVLATVARVVFIPLFMLCNVQTSSEQRSTPLINSDTAFYVIMLLFAISNGYLTSLLMMRGVMEEALDTDEVDIAASILLLYLTGGLALGAGFNFVLLAFV